MDFYEIYHFIFETYAGIGILVGAGLAVSIILAAVLERRTRKTYKNIEKPKGGWLDDDDGEEEAGE